MTSSANDIPASGESQPTLAPDADLHCPGCGYNLRGLTDPSAPAPAGEVRCPECGLAVDPREAAESQIPWSHRARVGRWRAYWRTVRMAMFRARRLAGEVARPVDLDDALRFRRVTVWLAYVPLAVVLVVAYIASLGETLSVGASGIGGLAPKLRGVDSAAAWFARPHVAGWLCEAAVVVAGLVGLKWFLTSIAGVASYFFHPPRLSVVQQDRAVALSYYACAPLACTPMLVALALMASWIGSASNGSMDDSLVRVVVVGSGIAAVVLAAVQSLTWFAGTVALLQLTTHCGPGRQVAAAVLLPVFGVLLLGLTLILPAAVAFLGLVVLSFS